MKNTYANSVAGRAIKILGVDDETYPTIYLMSASLELILRPSRCEISLSLTCVRSVDRSTYLSRAREKEDRKKNV